jgi:hypothetical protein
MSCGVVLVCLAGVGEPIRFIASPLATGRQTWSSTARLYLGWPANFGQVARQPQVRIAPVSEGYRHGSADRWQPDRNRCAVSDRIPRRVSPISTRMALYRWAFVVGTPAPMLCS